MDDSGAVEATELTEQGAIKPKHNSKVKIMWYLFTSIDWDWHKTFKAGDEKDSDYVSMPSSGIISCTSDDQYSETVESGKAVL